MEYVKYTEHMLLCSVLLLMIYISCSDFNYRIISNKSVMCVFFVAILIGFRHFSFEYFISLFFLYLSLLVVYYFKVLGGGDIKLMAALSLAIPSSLWLSTYIMVMIFGGFLALIYLTVHLIDKRFGLGFMKLKGIPYGIAISCGFFIFIMKYIYLGEM